MFGSGNNIVNIPVNIHFFGNVCPDCVLGKDCKIVPFIKISTSFQQIKINERSNKPILGGSFWDANESRLLLAPQHCKHILQIQSNGITPTSLVVVESSVETSAPAIVTFATTLSTVPNNGFIRKLSSEHLLKHFQGFDNG